MGFLSSIYLWLIPLATLPLLIHLFYNKKYHLVEFSSIKFLKDLEADSIKRAHILELILLIIRTLIIIFIILMLARPVIKNYSFESYLNNNEPIYCVIALDDSFSMTRINKTIHIKDVFLDKVNSIINTLPEKSQISIFKLSNQNLIFEGLKEEFSPQMLTGKMGQGSIDVFKFISYLKNQGVGINKEIHILSDLQDYSFKNIKETSLKDWNCFIHELNYIDNNLSISSVEIKNDIISINKQINIDVSIQNNGNNNAKNALLVLNIDNLNVGQQQIDLNAGESSYYRFSTVLTEMGNHTGKIELIYDNYDLDNSYLFDLSIPENINIGILYDDFNDFKFIGNSLKALNDNFKNLTISLWDDIIKDEFLLIDSDIVFVFGYNYISNNFLEASILESLNNGANVYVYPSSSDKIDNVNNDFFDFLSIDSSEIDFVEYKNDNGVKILSRNLRNKDLLAILGEKEESVNYTYMNIYKYFSLPNDGRIHIAIDGGTIWNEYSIAKGSVNILGFLPILEWTDLPIKASFISWIDYLATRQIDNFNKTYQVGDEFNSFDEDYTIILPDQKKYEYNSSSNNLFEFPIRGKYIFKNKDNIRDVLVNPPSNELFYNKISNDELGELFYNVHILDSDKNAESKIKEARSGIELWKYFLYIVIILILIEMVISNQFFRRN